MALAAAFILIWVNLAVGIIGDEGNSANLMYVGVLAAGIIRAIITRGQPRGMAGTLSVMAFAHALVPVIALLFLKITLNSGPACLIIFDVNSFVMMQSFMLFAQACADAHVTGFSARQLCTRSGG